ncbi:MAG TPA: hypothetical protein VGH20_22520 [Myxococcales bacterium]
MKVYAALLLSAALAACSGSNSSPAVTPPDSGTGGTTPPDSGTASNADAGTPDQVVADATTMINNGRQTFRHDTFGDEAFWSDTIHLDQAIEGTARGGVGAGVSPRTALAVGLKVDVDALPADLKAAIAAGQGLDDPANTVALITSGAVLGLEAQPNGTGGLQNFGVTCAICHSVVDNSAGAGVGHRLDGWPNRDLDVGTIINLAPDLSAVATLLGVPEATVRAVLPTWGPGKFDAELFLDRTPFQPDGTTSAATLIPPAFGLTGVNMHTWTGWGSVTYWNAFVAVLEMHGKGNFYDTRLDVAAQFPVAAANKLGHVTVPLDQDRVTPKLGDLQFYQLALKAPTPPAGSFDAAAAARGQAVFNGPTAKCATCHIPPLFTEPGWNMHDPADIGIDAFQANRAPDKKYRTSPLKGLFTHTKGGFYHDGRYADLAAVVAHYNKDLGLGLSAGDQSDLVEYLKSL